MDQRAGGLAAAFPLLLKVRSLGYLAAARADVMFAEGRTKDAIESWDVGERLGMALNQKGIVLALAGESVGPVSEAAVGRALPRLSPSDCELVRAEAAKIAALQPDYDSIFEGEYEEHEASLLHPEWAINAVVKDMDKVGFGDFMRERMKETPKPSSALLEQRRRALVVAKPFYAAICSEAKKPYWLRKKPDWSAVTASGDVGREVAMGLDVTWLALGAFDRHIARVRLVGAYAAVYRYVAEHHRPPASLAALELGDLGVDPFSGKQFVYRTKGKHFWLYSVGVNGRDDGGRPVNHGGDDILLPTVRR